MPTTVSIEKILKPLWENFDQRQKDVLDGRFGLDKFKEPQTLAALGRRYDISRERVRQIEALALEALKEKVNQHPLCLEIIERGKKYLKTAGGLAGKENFLKHHQSFIDLNDNHLIFLAETSGVFSFYREDKNFWSFYYLDGKTLKEAAEFIDGWADFLRLNREKILAEARYQELLENFIKSQGVNQDYAENYLKISKKIHTNSYGDIGLAEWPEIKPATVRDHIYLVLKKENKPLHFRILAQTINKISLRNRTALPATVHNELIKDPRFVLVGRGIYALAERGYQPGTAREVIQRIIRENGSLRPKEIILAVQKKRFFKPNTILVNLQNRNFFERQPDGTYHLRRSKLRSPKVKST